MNREKSCSARADKKKFRSIAALKGITLGVQLTGMKEVEQK
jgi:hypothetical protein